MNATERESMINNLYYIRERITNIISITETQKKVDSSYLPNLAEVKYVHAPEKIPMLAVCCIAFTLAYVLLSLPVGNVSDIALVGVGVFLYYQSWASCRKIQKLFLVFIYLLGVSGVMVLFRMFVEIDTLKIIYVIALAVLSVVCWFAVRKACEKLYARRITQIKKQNEAIAQKNLSIAQKNMSIAQENRDIQAQSNRLKQQLAAEVQDLQNFGYGWYPPDYYTLYAVDRFIEYFRNHRVNTMQEAVNTLKDDDFKQQYLKNQQAQIAGQRMVNAQLAFSNVTQMANLTAINQNTAAVKEAGTRISNSIDNLKDNPW